jgi:hypothetical protein
MHYAENQYSDDTVDSSSAERVSVARYSAEEVVELFLALYNCLDFRDILEDLGIGRFNFPRRNKALRELKALCIALWDLALQKSFPSDASDFFTFFLRVAPDLAGKGRAANDMRELVSGYVKLLEHKRDADFMPVADHLAQTLAFSSRDMPRLRLKISLITRNLYNMIFNKLV